MSLNHEASTTSVAFAGAANGPGKVNKQDFFQVFQGSGIGKMEDLIQLIDPGETWEAWLASLACITPAYPRPSDQNSFGAVKRCGWPSNIDFQHPPTCIRFNVVILEPEDVNGVVLPGPLMDCTVKQLSRWLQCRRLNRQGLLEDLRKRVIGSMGQNHPIDPNIDDDVPYKAKKARVVALDHLLKMGESGIPVVLKNVPMIV